MPRALDIIKGIETDAFAEVRMKNILMIGTGGTIASEMTDDGLTPELTPEQLLRYVPAFTLLLQKAGRSLLHP